MTARALTKMVYCRGGLLAQMLVIWVATLAALGPTLSEPLQAQTDQPSEEEVGSIVGTVTDVNGDTVALAKVVLDGPELNDRRSTIANDNGFFEFHDVKPGTPYHVTVSAEKFAVWASPVLIIEPNQYKILTDIRLRLATVQSTVDVTETPDEIAAEQVKTEEKQRMFGIIPNFYVVYDPNPVPLTAKLKFQLALKVTIDPITFLGIGILSGAQQAGDSLNYGQGAQGFAKRFGANTADGFTDIMIGGAILPSLLHQDPRYFYQGTGTTRSRARHAMLSPFVARGDNGKWQPNYSSMGGDLASSAISNLYYPRSNRGVGLVFENFGLGTGERIGASLAQEFLLHRFTHKSASP